MIAPARISCNAHYGFADPAWYPYSFASGIVPNVHVITVFSIPELPNKLNDDLLVSVLMFKSRMLELTSHNAKCRSASLMATCSDRLRSGMISSVTKSDTSPVSQAAIKTHLIILRNPISMSDTQNYTVVNLALQSYTSCVRSLGSVTE